MVAGERSGDIYGAELASALRARLNNAEIFGCGGEAMRLAGVDTVVDAHQLTMIGITEIVGDCRELTAPSTLCSRKWIDAGLSLPC